MKPQVGNWYFDHEDETKFQVLEVTDDHIEVESLDGNLWDIDPLVWREDCEDGIITEEPDPEEEDEDE